MEPPEPSSEEPAIETIEKQTEADSPVPSPAPIPLSDLQIVLERLGDVQQVLKQLTDQIGLTAERIEPLSRQVRQLGNKVDDLEESISHPRIRDLLNGLLLLHDLTRLSDPSDPQSYIVLSSQIDQILLNNGVYAIPVGERFDPVLHKAVEVVSCTAPADDGKIVKLYRPGFRTQQTVLRYAEVIVYSYRPPASDE